MPKDVIDFSVNLNPFGPPDVLKKNWIGWLDVMEDYPDAEGSVMVDQIAGKEQLASGNVLLGNGGAELIALVSRMLAGKRVLIVEPAFSEYEKMCQANGCEISYCQLTEGEWGLDAEWIIDQLEYVDALFLCHPNNPTGISYPQAVLLQILDACHKKECFMIVDEAFHDFLNEPQTLAQLVKENSYLIILRSLTKMYAIAGLRLGYLMADIQIVERLKNFQPHWSVNALALVAGNAILSEESYRKDTRQFIKRERMRVKKTLQGLEYALSNSDVNFYLLRDTSLDLQLPLFIFLLKKGIVPRHTANFPGLNGRWLRFAVKRKEENDMLLGALLEWKNNN